MIGKQERIASSELFTLMTVFLIGSAIFLPKGSYAGHDSWLAVALATGVGAGFSWIYSYLGQAHPGLTLIGVSEVLLGKWIGKLIGLLYFWYAFHLGTLVIKNMENLTLAVLLPETPPLVLDLVLLATVAWVVYEGIEVIGRCSLIVFGIFVVLMTLTFVLLIREMNTDNLLPLMDFGWSPLLRSTQKVASFPFGELILFMMVTPLLNRPEQVKRTSLWAVGIAGLFLVGDDLRNILIFGDLSTNIHYPSHSAIAYISVADFLERVEPFAFLIWLFSCFVKAGVCLYVSVLCLAHTIGAKDYRPFILPIAVLMLEMAQFIYTSQADMLRFAAKVWPWYSLPFQLFVPLLLLLISIVRRRQRKKDPIL